MLRNLINETDYSVIKKTKNLYLIFQILAYLCFIIICFKLLFIIQEPRILKKSKVIEFSSPTIFDTNDNILAQTLTSHRIKVNNFHKMTLNEKKELIFDVLKIDKKEANKINEITRNSFFIDRSPERNKILETLYIGNPYIKLESFPKREYPYYKYTKHLIGKTDIIENKGLSLIEKHSNKYKNNI